MNKIAIDVTALSDQYKDRGIGNYAYNVVTELIKDKKFEWHLIGYNDIEKVISNYGMHFHSLGNVKLSTPKNLIEFRSKIIPVIKEVSPDLYFAPHFEKGLPIGICKVVVMLHDVSPYLNNKYSTKGFLHNLIKGQFYKYNLSKAYKSDAILTNSNFTKSELTRIGFDKRKINVTYLGLSKKFDLKSIGSVKSKQAILDKYKIEQPYILYYGGFEPNKNVDKLLKVFKLVKDKGVKLVLRDQNLSRENGEVVAKSVEAKKVKKMIEEKNLDKDIIITGYIDWKDLPIINSNALAFVHLSEYEGFGLAVLEALASGCPVIAAKRSSYLEVVGDGGILVEPEDTEHISKLIIELLENERRRKAISSRGMNRAEKFSWNKCIEETKKVFIRILENDRK